MTPSQRFAECVRLLVDGTPSTPAQDAELARLAAAERVRAELRREGQDGPQAGLWGQEGQ